MNIQKTKLAIGVAAGLGLLVASTGAMAINTGTDLNLTAKARAGGMAGAAYTMPQEASAAVFGNPATLTQFKGINMNFGASLLSLQAVEAKTSTVSTGDVRWSNTAHSDADNYIVPDFGFTYEVTPNLVLGTGLEVDALQGVDYRDDLVSFTSSGVFDVDFVIELISLNTNLAAAYQASEKLSIGASVTVGFGLAQLGTASTTSSVHDIGFGGSIGATYAIDNGIMSSLTVKSPVRYNFKNILHNDGDSSVHQDLTLEQPLEIIAGIALDDVLADGLLVEADVIWKNWANAEAYQDVHDDQFLIALGAQYKSGKWAYRAGYSFAENMLLNETNDTIGSFATIGSVPFTAEVVQTLQVSLLPVIWQHTITVGVGYNITETISMDAYAAYAFGEEYSTGNRPASVAFYKALNGGTEPGGDGNLESSELEAQVDYELMVGVGINLSF